MKYSVIIPHYNSQESLKRCIRSIPQDERYQVIVIDDCSSKDKVDFNHICESVERPILIHELSTNSGAGAARNAGLALAKGEWIIFADSDDYFLPNADKIFEAYTIDSNADIIVFNIDNEGNMSHQGQRYWNFVKGYDGTDKTLKDIKYRSWAPWAKLYRNSFVKSNGLSFEKRRKGNDCFFVLNAMVKAKVINVYDTPVYHLTYSPYSLSHTNTQKWEYMYDVYDLWLWRYSFYKENNISLWKEYNVFYLLKEVQKTFGANCALKILLRSFHYKYSFVDLVISKLLK